MTPDPFAGPFLLIARWFWLVFIAVMLVNVAIWRRRLRELEAAGRATRAETDRFLRGVLVVLLVIGVANVAVVLFFPRADVRCLLAARPFEPAFLFVLLQGALTGGLLLWWVWARGGAETLARFVPALMARGAIPERPYSPRIVRTVVTLWVVGGLIAWPFAQRMNAGSFPHC